MKPFLQRDNIASLPALRAPGAAVQPAIARLRGSCAAPAAGAPSPQVEAIKEGDKVVRLVVTCACGERVEIECLYPAGA